VRSIPILHVEDIARLITWSGAAHAIRDALLGGLDPAAGWARSVLEAASGQVLLMPSESATAVGVKAVTVAPGNAALGLPRVHGAYLLFDSRTLELVAIMDGAALSTLRTPAVAMAAVEPAFGRFDHPVRVTIFGAGPQAVGHAEALATGGFAAIGDLAYITRNPERARLALGADASVIAAADPAVADRLRSSDVIVCTTTASTPLFDSQLVPDHAIVMVIGAHEAVKREVDGDLMARAMVVVEDRATALREAGDVVHAIAEGKLAPEALIPMADVIRGVTAPSPGRPYVFKSVGMPWEDLAVAEAIARSHAAATRAAAKG
jgi:ornithine cyclodeaminase/alanine dehydrogenase-like protein (mu-crystallin family)